MGGRLSRECLCLGVSRSPGNLGIAGLRRGMNSFCLNGRRVQLARLHPRALSRHGRSQPQEGAGMSGADCSQS